MKKYVKIFIFFILTICIWIVINNNCYAVEDSKITLISTIEEITNNVSNKFTYKIEPSSDNIQDGLAQPKLVEAEFDNTAPNSDNKAIISCDISFSDINYTNPGRYKYIVSEESSSDSTNFPKSTKKYEIYVDVLYNSSHELITTVYNQAVDLDNGEKTDLKFEHKPAYKFINIQNFNQGGSISSNEYFRYKLSIYGNVGDVYEIQGQDEFVNFEGEIIETQKQYIVKEGEENFVYIYLKHGQTATIGIGNNSINQIPIGTRYRISKSQDRKTNTTVNGDELLEEYYFVVGENPEENKLVIVNDREFDVAVTGVFINFVPFLILVIIAIIGIIIMTKLKKNDDENDK